MTTSQVLLDRWMHLLVEDVVSMAAKTRQEASLSAWAVLSMAAFAKAFGDLIQPSCQAWRH